MRLNKLMGKLPDIASGAVTMLRGKPYGFSFNVSDRCPVGCQCYWRAQERVKELSDDDVIYFFEKRKKEGFIHATLVGGEPYVRRDLLPKLVGILPITWIVTSGTTPLLNLKATHFISIDGPNARIHDQVRRMPGLYDRIIKHLSAARDRGEFRAYIHSVLNKLNYKYISDTVDVWKDNKLADGIVFSTMTPIKGANDDSLRLSTDDRAWIVEKLLELKSYHGNFMTMTEEMIGRLHPNYTKNQTPDTCGTARLSRSFYADGRPIPQCILSDKADCSECGCIVTAYTDGLNLSQEGIRTLSLGLRMSIIE